MELDSVGKEGLIVDRAPDDRNAEPPAEPLRTLTETASGSEVVFSPKIDGDVLDLIIDFAPFIVVALPQTCNRFLYVSTKMEKQQCTKAREW